MFGGPSEAVVAARETMGSYAATIESDTLNQDRLKDWVTGGFSPDHAAIVTSFQDLALAVGETTQAGVDLWLQYQTAVEAGNQAGIDAVMAQIAAWEDQIEVTDAAAAAAVEASEEVAAAAIAAVEEQKKAIADWTKSFVGSYHEMAESADAAYAEVGNAALAAGATQQEAEAMAWEAWTKHYDGKKELRIREMAYEAAFSAALAAVLAGNAEGATAIAKAAFFETRDAAIAAFDAIEAADISMRAGLTDTREADLASTIIADVAKVESAEVAAQQTVEAWDVAASALKVKYTEVADHSISESARCRGGCYSLVAGCCAAGVTAAVLLCPVKAVKGATAGNAGLRRGSKASTSSYDRLDCCWQHHTLRIVVQRRKRMGAKGNQRTRACHLREV